MIASKKLLVRLMMLIGLLCASTASAQLREAAKDAPPVRVEERAQTHSFEYYFPQSVPARQLGVSEAKAELKAPVQMQAPEVAGTTLYGFVKQGSAYKMLCLPLASTVTPEVKANGSAGFDYVGGVYKGGRFYVIGNLKNLVFPVYSYDVTTWVSMAEVQKIPNPYIVSMTCNQATDVVYGCFTNASATVYDFCSIDIMTGAKTTISAMPKRFTAVASNNGTDLYGVAVDGNLYRVDSATGAATVIGATGQTVDSSLQSATFDADNQNMFWAAGNTIYYVDTTTGAATAVAAIEGDAITDWVGLYSIPDRAGATPTWISNFVTDFQRDALSGTIGFTMPKYDTAGLTLSGTLEYHVVDNDVEILSGEAAPGANVSRSVTLAEGNHKIAVYTVNGGTKGMETSITRFVGHDNPNTPANLAVSATDVDHIFISWDAVTAGVNRGYIITDAIRYKVVRQPGDVVIAEAATGTTVQDATIDNLGFYRYEVTATDGVKTSATASTDNMMLGQDLGITPPYSYKFDAEDGFGLFTGLDANGDGYAWKYDDRRHIVWYEVNPGADSDDWLISPPINLVKDKNFNLKVSMTGSGRWENEYYEIYYGTSPDPKDMTNVIVAKSSFNLFANVDKWFRSAITGPCYIGVRIVTPAVEGALLISSFSIGDGYADGAPAQVTGAKVTAAPKGALSAEISFTLPTQTFAGTTLSSITDVKVINTITGKELKVNSPAPGKAITLTDNAPADGSNTYTIVSVNAAGESQPVELTTWVGLDYSGLPRNVKWTQIGDHKVRITWDAPTDGQNGGYVDFSALKYCVVIPSTEQVITNDCTQTSLEVEITLPSENQEVLSFAVCGVNDRGIGVGARSNESAYGTGYKCPFYESFEEAALHSTPWMVKQPEGYNSCNIITDIYGVPITSYDDTGMAVFTTLTKGSTRLEFPMLDLSTLKAPVLKMWVYFVGGGGRLVVRANNDSGLNWVDLKEVYNDGGEAGWHLVSVPLDRFSGGKRVQLGLEMYVDETPQYYYYILVDKISVVEYPDYDLMMTFMGVPQRVNAGDTFTSTVKITNAGAKRVEKYRLNATINGAVAAVKECGPIDPDEIATIDMEIPLSSNATSMELIIAAECEGDADPNNDAWISRDVQVIRSRYPQPLKLTNTSDEEALVTLEWTAPESRYQATLIDDMESYEHGSVGGIDVTLNTQTREIEAKVTEGKIGPYRLIDNDKQLTGSVQLMINRLPHDREGMVCQVIDLDMLPGIADFSTIWAAHSGSTMLCFWQSRTADDNYDTPNDDWLILPRLSEEDPRISFWAKSLTTTYGLESFEIMVSMDGDAMEDFESYQTVLNVPAGYSSSDNAGYTFYEFELPEGTQFAAIRYHAAGTMALLVDDISYTPDDNYENLDLIGYNVYRNGVRLNDEPLEELRFNDRPTEAGEYLYNVTSVFIEGESRYSNTVRVTLDAASIDAVGADSEIWVNVSGRDIEVNRAAGQSVALYSPDGRLLDSRTAQSDVERFTVAPGVYVIRVAGMAQVVVVK